MIMKFLNPRLFFLIHWPGVKKAGKDKANKVLNRENKEYDKGKEKYHGLYFFPLVCSDY